MKLTKVVLAAAFALGAAPAYAEGDVAEGEKLFAKRCKTCHMIADGDNVILKGGKTGPNLYGVVGRAAAAEDFKYGKSLIAAAEAGLVWNTEELSGFIADPKKYLRARLEDKKAKSKMSFKLKKEDQRADVIAYLATQGAVTN